jgi:hypothetical protein
MLSFVISSILHTIYKDILMQMIENNFYERIL